MIRIGTIYINPEDVSIIEPTDAPEYSRIYVGGEWVSARLPVEEIAQRIEEARHATA